MSDLTELEICQKIAEIEVTKVLVFKGFLIRSEYYNDLINSNCSGRLSERQLKSLIGSFEYNPITNSGLITDLIFKHEVNVDHYSSTTYIDSDYTDRPPIAQVSFDGLEGMRKAVCLVIIEANFNE